MGRLEPGHLQTETASEFPRAILRSRQLRERIGRTASGDAELILEYEGVHAHINYLLDRYVFEGLAVDLSADEEPTVEIPVKHAGESYSPQIESD